MYLVVQGEKPTDLSQVHIWFARFCCCCWLCLDPQKIRSIFFKEKIWKALQNMDPFIWFLSKDSDGAICLHYSNRCFVWKYMYILGISCTAKGRPYVSGYLESGYALRLWLWGKGRFRIFWKYKQSFLLSFKGVYRNSCFYADQTLTVQDEKVHRLGRMN